MKKFFNVFTILIIVFIFRSPLKDISNNLISYVQGNVNNIINKIDNEDEYINNSAIGDENNVEESVSDYNGSVSFDNYSTIKLYCGEVPPLPIPNREVKLTCADGTAMQCGRVGSRLLSISEASITKVVGAFLFFPQISLMRTDFRPVRSGISQIFIIFAA